MTRCAMLTGMVLALAGTLCGQEMLPLRDQAPGQSGASGGLVFPMGPYNGELLFRQDGHGFGEEIWATDGTAAGTYLLLDLIPGGGHSQPQNVFQFGSLLLFSADESATGTELWRSDGTAAGTYMLKDIATGTTDSYPTGFTILGSTAYFTAFDATNGRELWRTDGTIAGTQLVRDIFPGSNGSNIKDLQVHGSLLLFIAENNVAGREVWRSDGTFAGTVVVSDLWAGVGSSNPEELTPYNGELYFSATESSSIGDELYKTDGTTSGTTLVANLTGGSGGSSYPHDFTVMGSWLYFFAQGSSSGRFLWRSDGTSAGTTQVNTQSFNNDGSFLMANNGVLFFKCSDGGSGYEPWRSDGTDAGTYMLYDVNTGQNGSDPQDFTAVGNLVVFVAEEASNNWELWVSDGTTGGTQRAKTAGIAGRPDNLMEWNGNVYFNVQYEFWLSDGTDSGTHILDDLRQRGASTSPQGLVASGGELFYSTGSALWVSDGTYGGTSKVNRSFTFSAGAELFAYNSGVLFMAAGATGGAELWFSDGTDAGTQQVIDLNTSTATASGAPQGFALWGSLGVFTAFDGSTYGVYTTDGTAGGTALLKGGFTTRPEQLTARGTDLFFVGQQGANGAELWFSNGTTAGTVELKDINPTGSSAIKSLIAFGGDVYFHATNGTNGRELWISDGTSGGTQMLLDINTAGDAITSTADLEVLGSSLLFGATDGTNGAELWTSDGTGGGTTMLVDINTGAGNSFPGRFAVMGAIAVFIATDASNGREMWRTNGTAAGTQRIADMWPGPAHGSPSDPEVAGGAFWFTGHNPVDGREIWTSDGTVGATQMIGQTMPAGEGITARVFFDLGGRLLFQGDSGVSGSEIWIRAADVAPYVLPAQNSALTVPVYLGNELHYAASAATPLANAMFMLGDSTSSASLSLTAVTGATNGITPPGSASGLSSGASFSFTGTPAAPGTTTFTIQVSDGVNPAQTFLVIFDIGPDAPPQLVLPAGSGFSLTAPKQMTFLAVEAVALSAANLELFDSTTGAAVDVSVTPSATANGITPPSAVTGAASGAGLAFTGTPVSPGTTTFSVDLDDGTSVETWTIEFIVEVNDAPTIVLPSGSDFYIVSAGVYGYDANTTQALADATLRLVDPDNGAQLLLSVNPGTVNGIVAPTGATGLPTATVIDFTGTPTAAGTYTWTVSVSDLYNAPATVTLEFYVVVNNAPTAAPGSASIFSGPAAGVLTATVNQNQQLTANADINIYDADAGALLDYTVTPATLNGFTAPSGQTGVSSGLQLLWNGSGNNAGTYDFNLQIDDGIVVTTYTVRFIVVASVPPYLEPAPGSYFSGPGTTNVFSLQWNVGTPLSNATLRMRDATTGDIMSLSPTMGGSVAGITPPVLSGQPDGTIAAFTGTPNSTGLFTITMFVSDGTTPVYYDVEFDIVSGNVPPIFSIPAGSVITGSQVAGYTLSATVGTPLANASLRATDINAAASISIDAVTGTAPGVSSPSTGTGLGNPITLAWTGTPSQAGSYNITIDLEDNLGASASATLTIQVNGPPAAPAITSTPGTIAYAGNIYTYNVQMTGSPTPGLSAMGLPSWLGLSGSTLSGTPPASDIGSGFPVTLTASNGVGSDAVQFFILQVTASPPGTSDGGDGGEDSSCSTGSDSTWRALVLFTGLLICVSRCLRGKQCAR